MRLIEAAGVVQGLDPQATVARLDLRASCQRDLAGVLPCAAGMPLPSWRMAARALLLTWPVPLSVARPRLALAAPESCARASFFAVALRLA
ncbi:hypothetical protein QNM99_00555 [Pseudomonas sp. PCH446]